MYKKASDLGEVFREMGRIPSGQIATVQSAFWDAWNRVPDDDQAAIQGHRRDATPLCWLMASNFYMDYTRTQQQTRGYQFPTADPAPACVLFGAGRGIVVDVPRVCRVPCQEWIALVLAHELAHLYLFAIGHNSHHPTGPLTEETAIATQGGWGWD